MENYKPWGMEKKLFLIFLHLAQLAGLLIPFAGIVLPIVMWLTNKDQSKDIDIHGKNVVNWIISLIIYWLICFALSFVLIGLVLIPILVVINIIFAIIGAVKANDGEAWQYPLSIKFFK